MNTNVLSTKNYTWINKQPVRITGVLKITSQPRAFRNMSLNKNNIV